MPCLSSQAACRDLDLLPVRREISSGFKYSFSVVPTAREVCSPSISMPSLYVVATQIIVDNFKLQKKPVLPIF